MAPLARTLVVLATTLLVCACSSVPRPPPLARGDIVQLARAGMPAAQIIERLQATDSVVFLSASDILDMHREGVPPEVLDWLQREQLLELRRRTAFEYWRHAAPFGPCVGWPGHGLPPPYPARIPFWPYCY